MARLSKGLDFSVYSSPSFQFWFDEKWYTVQGAETMVRTGTKDDMSTMRSEYTRMRDAAQKRLKRLAKTFPESKAVQSHPAGFQKLKDIDPRDFPKAFSELAKFLRAKGSTVTGQQQIKEKTIKTWQDQGLNVNRDNYDKVIKILEESRKQKIVYGSDKVVELADEMMELSPDQFNDVLDNLSSLLEHSDEIGDALNEYMDNKEIDALYEVDIDDFIRELGW